MKAILLLILGLCWQPAAESRVLRAAKIQQPKPVVAEYYSYEDPPDINYPEPGPDQQPDAPGEFRCKDNPAVKTMGKNLEQIIPIPQIDENKGNGAIRPYQSRYFGKQNGQNVRPEPIEQLDDSFFSLSSEDQNSYITDNEGGGGNDNEYDGENHPTHFCVHKFEIRGAKNVKPYDMVVARNPRLMANNVGKRKKRSIEGMRSPFGIY